MSAKYAAESISKDLRVESGGRVTRQKKCALVDEQIPEAGQEKVRGHLMRAREQTGFGWKRWSREWLYGRLGLYKDYRLLRPWSLPKGQPVETVP